MCTASPVLEEGLMSTTRMPGFAKLTFASGAKFLPVTFRVVLLPGIAREGSTEVTSGVAGAEG
jgi:hypothetical protein